MWCNTSLANNNRKQQQKQRPFTENTQKDKTVACGRHGRLSGILEKLDLIEIDHTKYKKITIVREPIDRILSSWVYFFKEKGGRSTWKTIDDMLDSYKEKGNESAIYMPQTFWLCENNVKSLYILIIIMIQLLTHL